MLSSTPVISEPIRPAYRLVDWAKVTRKQMIEGDKGLSDRLAIWIEVNERQGRTVTTRHDFETEHLIYEAWEVV